MPVLKANEFYCVKCRAKVKSSSSPKLAKTKNNRSMLKGSCNKCSTKVCKFVKSK